MVDGRMTRFSKLHATGNDFLVTTTPVDAGDVVALCDRFTGIGADGVLLLAAGTGGADATMTLTNADGSIAEMSGNGARCLAWAARRTGLGSPERLVVDTGGGRRTLDLTLDAHGDVVHAVCDMGAVTFDPARVPVSDETGRDVAATVDGRVYAGDAAGVGNPHWVIEVDDPDAVDLARVGPVLEHDARFPARVNVEFVAVDAPDHVRMRVWERGAGETQSCGTGACASAAVLHRRGRVGSRVCVRVPGGDLDVELGTTVRLGGPVVHVFDVDVDLEALHRGRGGRAGPERPGAAESGIVSEASTSMQRGRGGRAGPERPGAAESGMT
jgi:diaminopimelate epimerase